MKKFSDEDLTRWKTEINAGPIIAARMKLRRDNAEYVGLCPFHEEKTPSFKVYRIDGGVWGYKCFGCQANGNVFQFVQKFDKITFTAAVEKVLAEAGVAGWESGAVQADAVDMGPQAKKEVVTFPIEEYTPCEKALHDSPAGQKWLTNRGIMMSTARRFHIGFVQDGTVFCGTNHPWRDKGWIAFPTLSADGRTVLAVKYRSLVSKKEMIGDRAVSGIMRIQDTATVLYNLREVTPTEDVFIVEGEPDTLVIGQAGEITVGLPSSSYKPTGDECDLLSTAKRRFIAGDRDKTGSKAMDALQLRLRGATFIIQWPSNRKDANDVLTNEYGNDPEKFKALLAELKARAIQTESEPVLRTGSDIKPQRVRWLWENKIPLGKLTLFAGNPDNGKSLASTSIAAICSTGRRFPEASVCHEPADVLMLLGEDDLEDTAVPRLMAAEANMRRIHFLEAVRPVQQEDREVRLDFDIPAIEKQLEYNPNIRLLIIDPISNYLGEVSMIAEQEVRSILIPLKRAAEKFNVAVLIVMHLNKKNDLDAISRVGGAMAFIGVARCSWLFVRQRPETVEGETEESTEQKPADSFSMLRIKNNLVSSNRAGMSYSVAVRPIAVDGEDAIITPYVQWGGVIEGSADEALGGGRGQQAAPVAHRGPGRPNDKLQTAVKWLENALQDGLPHPTKVLREDAKNEAIIKQDTLDQAWKAIGAKAVRVKGVWCWQVDPMDATAPPEDEPQQSDLIEVDGAQ